MMDAPAAATPAAQHAVPPAFDRLPDFQARLLDALDHAVIATDAAGRIILWNRRAEELYGWTSAEVIGRDVVEVTAQETTRAAAAAIMAQLSRGARWSGELLLRRKDGSSFLALVTDTPIRDERGNLVGVVGISSDVTEQRRTEEALRTSEARQRALLDAIPDLLFRVSADGTLLDFQPSKGPAAHVPSSEMLGRNLREVLPEEIAQASIAIIARALATGTVCSHEYQLAGAHGLRDYEARLVPCGDGEVLALVRDISERKQVDRARDEFLSIASHELRTPVTALRGVVQLLQRARTRGEVDVERLDRALSRMAQSSSQLVTLTEDLLDVSRLQAGKLDLRLVELDLATFASDIAERFRDSLAAQEHPPRVRLEADGAAIDGAAYRVQADPARLEQVLVNLLENARKYSPDGGAVELRISASAPGGVLLTVRDHGIGLPPDVGDTLFKPFGRAANATDRQIQGLGLGLSICRQIVEQHGGRIWAESEGEGKGSTFCVWLPSAEAGPPRRG